MSLLDRLFAGEHLVLDARVREKLPGKTTWLTDGVTYYEEGGRKNGPPVILIHGFSVPSFIWDPSFAALSAVGFRAIRYDLFGRGYSDRPRLDYEKGLFVRQLAELLESLQVGRASLLSLSMGGPIAAEFAFRFPKRVAKLAFIGPAGFPFDLPRQVRLLRMPVLGELILGVAGRFGGHRLIDSVLKDLHQPTQAMMDYFAPRYLEQMKYYGFQRSLLSTLRHGLVGEDFLAYRRLGQSDQEVLLIWGKEDQTIPIRNQATFRSLIPQTQFFEIAGAGHIPHFDQPDAVNQILIDFFARSSL